MGEPYQAFDLVDGKVTNIGPRMARKLRDVPLPSVNGKTVLDVGCDRGFWSFLCAERGAFVTGLDRGREVEGKYVNQIPELRGKNCQFYNIDLGRQWFDYGPYDVVLLLALYQHIFKNTQDHEPIWYWLWRHCKETLVWEGFTKEKYTYTDLMTSADRYFLTEHIGRSYKGREVFHFIPKKLPQRRHEGRVKAGAGGATKAFLYAEKRRMKEFEDILGFTPFPGSLNIELDNIFDWDSRYYRFKILDVEVRSKGLESQWSERWARAYPMSLDGIDTFAFRFEGEPYNKRFLELIAPIRLRDEVQERIILVQ